LLSDTNPNSRSGWQWQATIEEMRSIERPLVVFAVGYNRFRGQADFRPIFAEHLTAMTEQASYIGLRNTGSIDAVSSYLPASLHSRLRYQPCPTTILAHLDPTLVRRPVTDEVVVGVNLAFDRAALRYGQDPRELLGSVGDGLRMLEQQGARIRFLAQCPEDERAIECLGPLPTMDVRRLYGLAPREVIAEYVAPSIVIGTRGHSQMIPFGVRRPILSLITHDKLAFFLDDIGHPEWGIESTTEHLGSALAERVVDLLARTAEIEREIVAAQDGLWRTTVDNVAEVAP
jgi:hypothetical protein